MEDMIVKCLWENILILVYIQTCMYVFIVISCLLISCVNSTGLTSDIQGSQSHILSLIRGWEKSLLYVLARTWVRDNQVVKRFLHYCCLAKKYVNNGGAISVAMKMFYILRLHLVKKLPPPDGALLNGVLLCVYCPMIAHFVKSFDYGCSFNYATSEAAVLTLLSTRNLLCLCAAWKAHKKKSLGRILHYCNNYLFEDL